MKALLTIIMLLFLSTPVLPAEEPETVNVVIVKSASVKPYRKSEEGFRFACNCNVTKSIDVSVIDKDALMDMIYKESPDLIFSMGQDAFNMVNSINDIPILTILAFDFQGIMEKQKNIRMILFYISPEDLWSLYKETYPDKKDVGVVFISSYTDTVIEKNEKVFKKLELNLHKKHIYTNRDLRKALKEIGRKVDTIWYTLDRALFNYKEGLIILIHTLKNNLLMVSDTPNDIDAKYGITVIYLPASMGMQAGFMVSDKLIFDKNYKQRFFYCDNAKITVDNDVIMYTQKKEGPEFKYVGKVGDHLF